MYKVSVIIPAYNAERYIRECMESVLAQSLRNIQIICVNDGSTDRTAELLHQYAIHDDRVLVINQENAGYGHAVNEGIRAASGEYIGIVESDDYVSSDMYEYLWRIAHQHSLDFVKGDFAYFSGEGNQRIFDRIMICPKLSWYRRKLCPNQMPELLDADMMNVTGIYRRKFLLDNNILLRETLGAAFQDTGLWIQIFTRAKTCMFLPCAFYKIRRDNPNSSVMNPGKFDLICSEYEAALNGLTAEQREKFAPYLFRRKIFAYQFILSKIEKNQKKRFITKLSKEIQTAINTGTYDPELFTATMRRFFQDVMEWQENEDIPQYQKSMSFFRRMADCIQEHSFPYLVRRIGIRLHLHKEIF